MAEMVNSLNYEYFSSYIRSLPEWETLKVLDYGCGRGEVVELMRKQGIDAVGCDVFYEGSFTDFQAPEFVHRIDEKSPLPFGDQAFDVILANQVFEHIDDFQAVLDRLHRVLKDDGHMLLHFPSREVIREGHIGLPFVHWMRAGSKLRFLFVLLLRRAGFGYFKDSRTPREWTRAQLEWVDRYCFYKPYRRIRALFERQFTIEHNELQYIRYRVSGNAIVRTLLRVPGGKWMLARLFRRLAFIAVILRKRVRGR